MLRLLSSAHVHIVTRSHSYPEMIKLFTSNSLVTTWVERGVEACSARPLARSLAAGWAEADVRVKQDVHESNESTKTLRSSSSSSRRCEAHTTSTRPLFRRGG